MVYYGFVGGKRRRRGIEKRRMVGRGGEVIRKLRGGIGEQRKKNCGGRRQEEDGTRREEGGGRKERGRGRSKKRGKRCGEIKQEGGRGGREEGSRV